MHVEHNLGRVVRRGLETVQGELELRFVRWLLEAQFQRLDVAWNGYDIAELQKLFFEGRNFVDLDVARGLGMIHQVESTRCRNFSRRLFDRGRQLGRFL